MWILHYRVFSFSNSRREPREIHYPSIEEYMRNKKAIREEIADSLGVD